MNPPSSMLLHPATGLLPTGAFLMTAAFEGRRAGVLVESVQSCGDRPPLLCITMVKGHWIEPLIRDSHAFAICVLDPADKLTRRKFVEPGKSRESGDPFDCMPVETIATGSPILKRAIAALDCQVTRHLDVDTEHALYIGTVIASRVYQPQTHSHTLPHAQTQSQSGLLMPPSSMTG